MSKGRIRALLTASMFAIVIALVLFHRFANTETATIVIVGITGFVVAVYWMLERLFHATFDDVIREKEQDD